ncbi:MAG: hypothetical protein CMH83_04775 [Nocardioides sp.]|nr:hypothetical protein [Nocardioides sp.]
MTTPSAHALPDFPVESLHVRTFARALGDTRSEESCVRPGAAVPPTFTIATAHVDPDNPLRPREGERWVEPASSPTGLLDGEEDPTAGVLYAEQHFDLVRSVRVGETLHPTVRPGRTWEKEGRRGGTLSFFEEVTELRDDDGEVVVRSTLVGVRTAQVPGAPAMSAVPVPAVGDVLETVLVDDLTRTRIVQYAGASGDFNPLHTDPAYATAVAGFPDVFAHGMLTMGMTARVLTDRWGNDAVRHLGGRFVAQVWPGDTLTARA